MRDFFLFDQAIIFCPWDVYPFYGTGLFLSPLEISENQSSSDVLRGIERGQWLEIG